MNRQVTGNPIIKHFFTADPTVLVHDGIVYLYTGHDEAGIGHSGYVMNTWLGFSSNDLIHWQDHGILLRATDFKWSSGDAYASKVIQRGGKFYWYVSVTHAELSGKAIGVAVSNSPAGPFEDARGSAMITHDMLPPTENEKANLDPTVLVDDDGQTYIFWGNGTCYFARLKENMIELDGPVHIIDLPDFQEGAHIHKRNGWYYLSYGYQFPEKVAYAMSRDILGPWDFKGILNETVFNCETNRPAIIDFRNESYFFYHIGALPNGSSHRRSVCLDRLRYNQDGTMQQIIMTSEGV
ncbi:glycoside hydrolase family 43 protein [Dyadobacter pollutisoli]|uniref:Glycoside hydrolase family 43 protein n=1 Tax=Dyadobacter pollutisoli TaxID=2910158 RepID=A0A9E8N414_9BACT|nr:glycoside hydrolase family 43 protein [Dyadobacter pollutisoli]WAC09305.1 glycoside hydrolase family 43 protein [Dyadobacter pollutisoli]